MYKQLNIPTRLLIVKKMLYQHLLHHQNVSQMGFSQLQQPIYITKLYMHLSLLLILLILRQ